MKKIIPFILGICIFNITGCFQSSEPGNMVDSLNFNFEHHKNGIPTNWKDNGSDYIKVSTDSIHRTDGKFSIVIENTQNDPGYKTILVGLPNNYKGKSIHLSGYIKTENVANGYAGLFMKSEPEISYRDMKELEVTGTTDWAKYDITMPLSPENTDTIFVGGLLMGNGKMWMDKLEVTIDGKSLDDKSLETLPVKLDKEFDNGSNISFPTLNNRRVEDLAILGRIWGFLKYHHPIIAQGDYNWDYELFRVLPQYLKIRSNLERDGFLVDWIDKLGVIPKCKSCKSTHIDAFLQPDLSWIDDSNLSSDLKSMLHKLYMNRNEGPNKYIELYPAINNPIFTNEKYYQKMPFPDSGFRLLSLFRYWNIIEYFFPYKNLIDDNWNSVLTEYIPKFLSAKSELEYELSTLTLIEKINDSHANLWGGANKIYELRGENYAPFKVEFVQKRLVVTEYFDPYFHKNSKLKIGDVITHINGKSVEDIIDSVKTYYPASNEVSRLRDISADLLRSPTDEIRLRFLSQNRIKTEDISLITYKQLGAYSQNKIDANKNSLKMLEDNIGYISLANIKYAEINSLMNQVRNTKGIIIDIRNYPSAFVAIKMGSHLVSKPTHFVKFTKGNPNNPGEFTYRPGELIKPMFPMYSGKVVVLVNEKSQSQAEYTAMAFRAGKNTTIVGSETAGADGNVSTIPLPGGLRTAISGNGVFYPDGTETQRIGIIPDVVVKPTLEGIKQGRDEVLTKAIEIIQR